MLTVSGVSPRHTLVSFLGALMALCSVNHIYWREEKKNGGKNHFNLIENALGTDAVKSVNIIQDHISIICFAIRTITI